MVPTKLLFVSESTLDSNGTYSIEASYSQLGEGELYVEGSLFKIVDQVVTKIEAKMYLSNGPQKSAKSNLRLMDPYDSDGYPLDTDLTA